ncbi:MAG TPA: carboxypeptidase-like regulatory domain-containing protein [Blastocatellia bacterium]|nr:carboxypeptidase-like regulatory domain-containing protein [Blastocatellia bacterium]
MALTAHLLPATVRGQSETGSLSVSVVSALDRNPISDVTVTITDLDTKKSRVGKTSADGSAFFAGLEPGTYEIRVSPAGVSGETTLNVNVQAGGALRVEVPIQQISFDALTTEAARRGIMNTAEITTPVVRSGVPHEITSARSDELLVLPNLNNDITPLLQVVPGAIAIGPTSLGRIVIDGKGRDQQTFRLDGMDSTPLIDTPAGDPAIGVLDTFQKQTVTAVDQKKTDILSRTLKAINGPGTGSVTEMVSQSGGTEWNFQAYNFMRNDALNARNYFDYDGKNAIRRNLFGGNIGGPITKTKSFLFASYEGIRGRTERNVFEAVPAEVLCRCGAGTFTPYLEGFLPQGTGIVPGASLDPNFVIAHRRLRTISESGAWDLRLDFSPFAGDEDANTGEASARSNDSITFRFTRQAGEALVPDGVTGRTQRQQLMFVNTLLSARLFRGRYIHTFKVGLNENRASVDTEMAKSAIPDLSQSLVTVAGAVKTSGLPANIGNVPVASLGGVMRGAGRGFRLTPVSAIAAYDASLPLSRGTHVMSFGFETRFINLNYDRLGGLTYAFPDLTALRSGTPGSVTFLSDLSAPSPFTDTEGPRHARQKYYMGFFQMVSNLYAPGSQLQSLPRLVLTYGVRYDYFSPVRERDNRAVVVDPQTGEFLRRGAGFYRAEKANIEPRFGLVYLLPVGKGLLADTTLRAGAGIYTGVPKISDLLLPIDSDRFSTGLPGGVFPADPRDIMREFVSNPLTRQAQPLAFARNFATPERAYKWEAALERKLGAFGDLRLGYIGNVGRNLPIANVANPIVRVETNPDPSRAAIVVRQFDIVSNGRVFKPFGEFFYRSSEGHSSYNGMTISLERNTGYTGPLPRGLNFSVFKAQYTVSRNVGNASGLVASNPFDLDSDYGYNAVDARHSFSVSAAYPLANAFRDNPVKLISDWTISTLISARSGLPLLVLVDRPDVVYVDGGGRIFASPAPGLRAVVNTPGGGATGAGRVPDLLPGVNPYIRNGLDLLNPAAFALPAPGTFGNLKRGQLRGPGAFQVDLAVKRSLFDKEKTHGFTAEIKVDFINIFNRPNFNNPVATLPNALPRSSADNGLQPVAPFTRDLAPSFGVFSAADPGRQIQFSLTLKLNRSR